jgi:hypothetical protein
MAPQRLLIASPRAGSNEEAMPAFSERDRRFALLVSMMSPGRRRGGRRMSIPEASMEPDEQPVVSEANKERLRAGVTGHNVRYVLIVSVALVIFLFVVIDLVMRQ